MNFTCVMCNAIYLVSEIWLVSCCVFVVCQLLLSGVVTVVGIFLKFVGKQFDFSFSSSSSGSISVILPAFLGVGDLKSCFSHYYISRFYDHAYHTDK